MSKPLPSQKHLHDLFEYSPTTGLFTYKVSLISESKLVLLLAQLRRAASLKAIVLLKSMVSYIKQVVLLGCMYMVLTQGI